MPRLRRNVSSSDAGGSTSGNSGNSKAANGNNSTSNKSKNSKSHNKSETNSTHSNNGNSGSSTSTISSTSSAKKTKNGPSKSYNSYAYVPKLRLDPWKTIIGCVCLIVACIFGYRGYLETRINTPFDNEKIVTGSGYDTPERFWGSYRPHTYFGMKTRDQNSLVMGLMWYTPSTLGHRGQGMRHWCEISDNLNKYSWTHHDGETFGVQEILDAPFEIKTSFVKYGEDRRYGGDWTARISVRNTTRTPDRSISLIWYVALDDRSMGKIRYVSNGNSPEAGVVGSTMSLGDFKVRFNLIKGKILQKSYLSTIAPSLSKLSETLYSYFRIFNDHRGYRYVGLPGEMISKNGMVAEEPNFISILINTEYDITIDITYQSLTEVHGESILTPHIGKAYTDSLQEKITAFDQRFEKTFQLQAKGYSSDEIKFAKEVFSNLIGGIGYFHGSSKVKSKYTPKPVPYWRAPLYTAVPSRSFFPRGFLWDEGFHGLLLSSWDIDIVLDIMCHWFDLLNVEGWIPRELILGAEALAKVPKEFVVQHNSNGNPPTFFLTLDKILTHHSSELAKNDRIDILEKLYPRLQAWFNWYNITQDGEVLGTYYWRGRNASSEIELNPKTLTSGLDDYPRASHPTSFERHLDLRCWMALASKVMSDLSDILGKDSSKYYETYTFLTDNSLLNEQHLSPFTETYTDWGLHTDAVSLKRPQLTKKMKSYQSQPLEMVRFAAKQPNPQFVDTTFGYVNLFPFLLHILDHDSPQLEKLLHDLRDRDGLWTNYGLRSLSKNSPLYMKRNTEHDPPYWRGPIWININYLAIRALHHYGMHEGPYAKLAQEIYNELRENVVGNIYREYQRTGYVWEQYDDTTGQGKGCYPFTGWTSLVVLIMSEQY